MAGSDVKSSSSYPSGVAGRCKFSLSLSYWLSDSIQSVSHVGFLEHMNPLSGAEFFRICQGPDTLHDIIQFFAIRVNVGKVDWNFIMYILMLDFMTSRYED